MRRLSSVLLGYSIVFAVPVTAHATSTYEIVSAGSATGRSSSVHVDTVDAKTGLPIPVRSVVTSCDDRHLDGSGRGVYSDGRFFADGSFVVDTPPGETTFAIAHGPHYVPMEFTLDIEAKQSLHVKVRLSRWFAPQKLGWYAGDNHVHAQHDQHAAVSTDLNYAALQGRAAGLSFVTEAGSNVSYADIDLLDRRDFLLRYAPEIRPGPYVGHLNTPGIRSVLPHDVWQTLVHRPLPAQAVFEAVRQRGGVSVHTHPMTPRHQLHWMGAAEAYSDAVLGNCANLLDVDANHTQHLWFAMLNLGNKVGVSSSTDSALGRTKTLSPGDRRIYCRAKRFDYPSIVDAMRRGRTMATNGGSVFAFLSVDGNQPGDTVTVAKAEARADLTVKSLHPLRSVELYQNGERAAVFPVQGRHGSLHVNREITLPDHRSSWLVARAEDNHGKWCLTSPIYIEPKEIIRPHSEARAWTILLEVNNATRFVQLRPQYFAHLVATVSPGSRLRQVELQRNGEPLRTFLPVDGNRIHEDRVPVTGAGGEYHAGWVWHPKPENAQHFQADWPTTLSGWYSVRVTTEGGQSFSTDQLLHEASDRASHTLSIANLTGLDTHLTLWGYGEDVPISDLHPPFDKGEWWYPRSVYWRLMSRYGKQETELGWPSRQPAERFRQAN
jgi:hypothetical protein